MNITLYETEDVFNEHCDSWHELLGDSHADQIFLTCEWQSAWWEAYQPGELFVLVVRDDNGRWQGIAPWFIDASEPDHRVVRTVGCVDVTDYLDIVTRRDHEQEVLSAILAWLAENHDRFDELMLCNIPESSPTLRLVPELAAEFGLEASLRLQEVCPVVMLPPVFTDYIAGLDKKNRHELRRKLRRAAGEVDWYIVGPEHDLAQEMATFVRLMASSSEDKATFIADPANRRFFDSVIPRVAERGWLQLAFITVRGEQAAAYLNFTYGNRVLVYNSGIDPLEHGQLSPGIVLLARLIEHAIVQGYETFDFLRGDEAYKYDMGGRDTNVYQLAITLKG